jgi:tRNA(His) guanylyltransferase
MTLTTQVVGLAARKSKSATKKGDSLGDRMKKYESIPRNSLSPRVPVVVRLDGKAFHTFTRGFPRPFDAALQDAMVIAARAVAAEMQGFKLAYVQSDEASFVLTDYDTLETSAWFDYDQQKVASVAASVMTAHFNVALGECISRSNADAERHNGIERSRILSGLFPDGGSFLPSRPKPSRLAYFDGRAYSVPISDVPNYFLWRSKDWERNSLTMYASSFFSHKQLHGKTKADRHEMLHSIGKNWAVDVDERSKNGTFFKADGGDIHVPVTYEYVRALVEPLVLPPQFQRIVAPTVICLTPEPTA